VGAGEGEFLGEEGVGFEANDAPEETESPLHGVDGGGFVPFDEGVAGGGRIVATAVGERFLIVCESDAQVVSENLLQKKAARVGGLNAVQRCR